MKLRLIAAVLLVAALFGLLTLAGNLRDRYDRSLERYRSETSALEQRAEELAQKQAELDRLMQEETEKQEYVSRMNENIQKLTQQVQQLEQEKEALAAQAQQLQAAIDALRGNQAEDSDEAYYLEVYDELTEGLNKVKEYLAGH
jgi:chromosome segregation ATPase